MVLLVAVWFRRLVLLGVHRRVDGMNQLCIFVCTRVRLLWAGHATMKLSRHRQKTASSARTPLLASQRIRAITQNTLVICA